MKKNKTAFINDPYRAREEEKYSNPICSREYIISFLKEKNMLFSFDHLAAALDIKKTAAIKALLNRIKAMLRDGQLKKEKNFIGLPDYISQSFIGYISMNIDNNVIIVSKNKSFFVTQQQRKMVFIGDEVQAITMGYNRFGQQEAFIEMVLKRKETHILGYYKTEFGMQLIQSISKEINADVILLPTKEILKHNDVIRAKFIVYPTMNNPGVVKFIEHIDLKLESANVVEKFIALMKYKYSLPEIEHPTAESLALQDIITPEERLNRVDMTHLPFFTIDGSYTQDIDDAIYVNNNTLYVAIADVAHYVKPNSILDTQAKIRASSIYFPNNTQHMLPEKLSQDLCSLQPHKDRLTLVCEMKFNKGATITETKVYEAIICSKAKLSYDKVTSFIMHKTSLIGKAIEDQVMSCYELYLNIEKHSKNLNALKFDINESNFIFDANKGKVEDITLSKSTISHKIIEQFMINANESISKYISLLGLPCVYRVNLAPTLEKIKNLNKYLKTLDLDFKNLKPTALSISRLINQFKQHKNFQFISIMIIRSLSPAYYTTALKGHFALDLKYYSHFTSPIRRYADLLIHRIIKYNLNSAEGKVYDKEQLEDICFSISKKSRNIDFAESDVRKFLKCHFLQKYIGHVFTGVVVQINNGNMYVNILQFDIEGCISNHTSNVKKKLYPGDSVQVKISQIDPISLSVTLVLFKDLAPHLQTENHNLMQ